MLELPEVLTLSKQANDVLSGKTITQVSMLPSLISSRFTVAIHWSMESCSSERRFCRLKDMECLSIFTCRAM